MVDPISAISGGMSIAKGTYDFLNFVRGIKGTDVIAALFDEEGRRTDGNDKIEIERFSGDRADTWWFRVKEIPGYVFDRVPLTASCVQEMPGKLSNEQNPRADYWRWYAMERIGTLVDGASPPNIKVRFIVVGYKPKALLKYFTS